MKLSLKRAYDQPDAKDGVRILVDRLWPRGLTKDKAHIDAWVKSIAPSAELRQWYQHDPEKWPEFRKRYNAELKANPEGIKELLDIAGKKHATLLYSSKEEKINNAVVLKEYLEKHC